MSDVDLRASVRQRWLGERLQEMRLAAGHNSLSSAAKVLERSAPSISRLENGQVVLPVRDFPRILDGYEVADVKVRERILAVASEIQQERRGWWVDQSDHLSPSYVELLRLEAAATSIRTFELGFIPGLLQDEGYARVAAQSARTWTSPEEFERFVEVRRKRQGILAGDNPVDLHAVISEAVLRQRLGGPEIFARQLETLLDHGAKKHITIQILPFSERPNPGLTGAFTVLSLPQLDFVHVELMTSDIYVEDEQSVDRYNDAYTTLTERSLTPAESARYITGMMKETIR